MNYNGKMVSPRGCPNIEFLPSVAVRRLACSLRQCALPVSATRALSTEDLHFQPPGLHYAYSGLPDQRPWIF